MPLVTFTKTPAGLVKAAQKRLDQGEAVQGVIPAFQFVTDGSSMNSGNARGGNSVAVAIIATNKRYLIRIFQYSPFGFRVNKHGTEAPRSTSFYLQPADRTGMDDYFMTESFGYGLDSLYLSRSLQEDVTKLNEQRPQGA
jgi:hypothetical protein